MNNIQFLQRLGLTLKQPQWVAVILSLGFHGALFAAGPSFSSLNMNALGGNVPESERRQVPLIELTPEEQSRLPDFSGSSYSLFSDQSDSFELFPPSGSSLPLNPPPDVAGPGAKPSPSNGSAAVGIAPYTPPRRPSLSFLPPRTPLSTLPRGAVLTPRPPRPQADRTPLPSVESTPSGPTPVQPDSFDGPTASDLALANPDEQNSSPLLEGGEGPPADASADPLQAQIEALAYRPENITEEEAEANLEAWQAALEERLPGELDRAEDPIEVQLSYVQRLCLDPKPNDALLGLVALPTESGGDLELFPQVLQSTGYPFLDQEAVLALNDLNTPSESDEAAPTPTLEPAVMYQVRVDVDYDQDTCIDRESLLENIKANQEAETPSEPAAADGQSPPAATPEAESSPSPDPDPTPEAESKPPTEAAEPPGAEALQ